MLTGYRCASGSETYEDDKCRDCRATSIARFTLVANGQNHRRIRFVAAQGNIAAAAEVDDLQSGVVTVKKLTNMHGKSMSYVI